MIKCSWTGRVLGRGTFGTVLEMKSGEKLYAGKAYNEIPRSKKEFIVRLFGELAILKQVDHPNIVQSVGITFDATHSPIILMECMHITLQEYVLDIKQTVSLAKKLKLLHDVANGLLFLHTHNPTIIHRDLTATNVLLDSTLSVAKISDFGNARLLDLTSGHTPLSSEPGTLQYMPPEVFHEAGLSYDTSLDVFSFGHLILFTVIQKIITHLPGPTYADDHGIHGRSELDRRECYVTEGHQTMGRTHPLIILMERCLHNIRNRRPSTNNLVDTLSHVVSYNNPIDSPQL